MSEKLEINGVEYTAEKVQALLDENRILTDGIQTLRKGILERGVFNE